MELFIIRSLLPPFKRHRYLRDGENYDYLGQILVQLGHTIPDGIRFPSELNAAIPPFTFPCRGSYHDSILTTRILQLDLLDPCTHEQRLKILLPQYTITWK